MISVDFIIIIRPNNVIDLSYRYIYTYRNPIIDLLTSKPAALFLYFSKTRASPEIIYKTLLQQNDDDRTQLLYYLELFN